ncbi:MAG: hypothetical protein MUE90_15205 [Thermoanaerobaculales bacterium]|jgi:hypothetical protein|nr:hypothetical protein [Thermoanaerobaculales bacterium]
MKRSNRAHSRARAFVPLLVAPCLVGSAFAADPPRPTLRPGTLAEYASRVRLRSTGASGAAAGLTLDGTALAELARQGSLTLGAVAVDASLPPPAAATAADRARWRSRYLAQQRVVEGLERRRLRLAGELDRLESGRLSAAAMARIDRAESELRALDEDIRSERAELARIVRDARGHGAEPGWFR